MAVIRAQLDQARCDEHWAQLLAHHDETVSAQVREALKERVRCTIHVVTGRDAVTGHRFVRCEVHLPNVKIIPRRVAVQTAGKASTTRRRTDVERNATYLAVVASTILAVVRATLASSPSTDEVHVLVLQHDAGRKRRAPVPVYSGQFPRPWVAGFPWPTIDPVEAVRNAPGAVMRLDRTRALGSIAAPGPSRT